MREILHSHQVLQGVERKTQKGEKCMKELTFDVMLADRYVCTMRYKYCPLFPIDTDELHEYVLRKRPTLRNKKFRIEF